MVRVERSCVSAKVCWGRAGNRPEGITCKCGNSGMLTQNLGWWCIALQKQNQVGGNDTSGRGLDKTWGINRARGSHAGQQCATRKDSTKAAEARSLRLKFKTGQAPSKKPEDEAGKWGERKANPKLWRRVLSRRCCARFQNLRLACTRMRKQSATHSSWLGAGGSPASEAQQVAQHGQRIEQSTARLPFRAAAAAGGLCSHLAAGLLCCSAVAAAALQCRRRVGRGRAEGGGQGGWSTVHWREGRAGGTRAGFDLAAAANAGRHRHLHRHWLWLRGSLGARGQLHGRAGQAAAGAQWLGLRGCRLRPG